MEVRRLGNDGPDFTVIGLGTWAMGGSGWSWGWGPQDDQISIATIRAALAGGVNWVDTAPVYGLGHAETVLRRALEGWTGRVFIATKCGLVWNRRGRIRASLEPHSIREECEASLRRLGVDVIDLYQIHWPEPPAAIERAWETLVRLKEEGKVRWIGVCNFDLDQLQRIQRIHPIQSLQPPYNLVNRRVEARELLFCRDQGIGVVAYSPLASGLLSGTMTRDRASRLPRDDWRRRDPRFRPPVLDRILALVADLDRLARDHGRTVAQLAVAWVLRRPEVTSAIVGARRPEQVEQILGAAEWTWTEDMDRAVAEVMERHAASLERVPLDE